MQNTNILLIKIFNNTLFLPKLFDEETCLIVSSIRSMSFLSINKLVNTPYCGLNPETIKRVCTLVKKS